MGRKSTDECETRLDVKTHLCYPIFQFDVPLLSSFPVYQRICVKRGELFAVTCLETDSLVPLKPLCGYVVICYHFGYI